LVGWLVDWIGAAASGEVADSNARSVLAPKTIQKTQRGFRYIVSRRSGTILLFETVHRAIWLYDVLIHIYSEH
jgi:hypothetical protein